MKQVRIAELQPGMVLDLPMYSPWGQKLLDAGVKLTQSHIATLRRANTSEIFMARCPQELEEAGMLRRVDRRSLKAGQRSDLRLVNGTGQVLVEPGEEIEEHHIEAMAVDQRVYGEDRATGTDDLTRRRNYPGRLKLTNPRDMVVELERSLPLSARRAPAHAHPMEMRKESIASPWPDRQGLVAFRQGHIWAVRRLYARIEAGRCVPIECLGAIVDELLDVLGEFPRRFCQLGIRFRHEHDHLPDHAFAAAVLAMAAARQMNWDEQSIRAVGLAALTMDLGMLRVPRRIHHGGTELDTMDIRRIHEHPLESIEMLQQVLTVPPIVKLAVYQHHEREDASGYPMKRHTESICDLARLLAVADAFTAMTERRSHREARQPYAAMREILDGATRGEYWKPAIKAMIQAAGLFPVGSRVRLSDGRAASVVAANAQRIDKPVVEIKREDPDAEPVLIDLSDPDHHQVSVAEALN
ncbi:MAG: HD domain-containing protein [Phycisphaeraceae bacterium]|nr:HD domain-containing protein [Phycisphaeraceae bacterium]